MKTGKLFLNILLVSAVLFFVSSVPYFFAHQQESPESKFLGQIAYLEDQNMYFSFIRQAYDGHVIFKNNLTSLQHSRVFLNLQWLAVGLSWKMFRLSENQTYQLWRIAGILALVSGFFLLSPVFFHPGKRLFLARVLFLFGGGFGIFMLIAFSGHLIDEPTLRANIPDLSGGGNPFQQMTSNPHFSLPHGLMLWGFALFLIAEVRKKTALYYAASALFAFNGLVRPYDLMSISVIFPAYAIIESFIEGWDKKRFVLRILPAVIVLPVLLYSIGLFKAHPVFKWWSMQGLNAGTLPALHKYILIFGLAGILAFLRIVASFKGNPFSFPERFLLVWFFSIFVLVHAGILIPAIGFSPQLGTLLTGPLVLLGMATPFPAALSRNPRAKNSAIALFLVFTLSCSFAVAAYFAMRFHPDRDRKAYYATPGELQAWQWLNSIGVKNKVVLASPKASARISKYTSASTVAGHYSVTPQYERTTGCIKKHFSLPRPHPDACALLSRWNVDYIVIEKAGDSCFSREALNLPCISRVFFNENISIYHYAPTGSR
ncbi:MAG: hypothetical protein JXA71_17930 [Chitinispirillaceae bacterium]|nr:hypothetical protein [Chitinispirillaceae bacterium]